MKALSFLLARKDAGEWKILETGYPREVRQKYKGLLNGKHDYTELFYSDHFGKVKRKVWRSKMAATPESEIATEAATEPEPEAYTGTKPRRKKGDK